jgi:hypothetical protein
MNLYGLQLVNLTRNTQNTHTHTHFKFLSLDNFTAGFSDPWKKAYPQVFQLSDFKQLLEEERVPKIWMGLLDQLMLTQAKVFVGTRLSTFR